MPAGFGRVKQDAGSLPWQERAFSPGRSVIFPVNYSLDSSWTRNKSAKDFCYKILIYDDPTAFPLTVNPLIGRTIRDIRAILVDSGKLLADKIKAEKKRQRALDAMEKLRGSGNGGLVEALLEERGRERTDSHESTSTPRVFSGAERQRALNAIEKLRGSGDGELMEALLEERGDITLLPERDIGARLDELRHLEAGWFDGKGVALAGTRLDWLAHQFDALYAKELELPFLYPTLEGGVQAEWSIGDQEITLEMDLAKQTAEWHRLDIVSEKDEFRELNLNEVDDWFWINARIGLFQKAVAA